MTDLRPYQQQAVDDLRASIGGGHRAPILVSPCGSGKTHIAKAIIDSATEKKKTVLFLAPRRELIFQCSEKLTDAGIHHGIFMAGERRDMFAPVQVGSVPTIHSRMRAGTTVLPPANLVIIDEAHLAVAKTTLDVLKEYESAVKIGMTATPCRQDGKGLGLAFDDLVFGPTMPELVAQGHLVPTKYFAPSKPDLSAVKIQMGDYNQKSLGAKMNDPIIVGSVITNWLRLAPTRQTVVFAVNVAHSVSLCERFQEVGVKAEHLDANTPSHERASIFNRFESGDTQVICNCQIFSYGVDSPPASCCVLAHPTKSLTRYLQAAGRVLRPYEGKEDCYIIDHSGIIEDLGFLEDEHPWSLDGGTTVKERSESTKKKEPKSITCPECDTIFEARPTCPMCGYNCAEAYAKAVEERDADLEEIERKSGKRKGPAWPTEKKEQFYRELLGHCASKGYKAGWAYHKYQGRFDVGPANSFNTMPLPVSAETQSWITSRNIAYHKSKKRQEELAARQAAGIA